MSALDDRPTEVGPEPRLESTHDRQVWNRVNASPEFQELRSRFRRFAMPVTVAALSWYVLYVLLTAYARDFMRRQVFDNLNIGFVLGVAQFATTFLVTWIYEKHSTKTLDPLALSLKASTEKELDR